MAMNFNAETLIIDFYKNQFGGQARKKKNRQRKNKCELLRGCYNLERHQQGEDSWHTATANNRSCRLFRLRKYAF